MESTVSRNQFQEPNSTLIDPSVSTIFQDPTLTKISTNSEYLYPPYNVPQTYEPFTNFLTNTMEVLTSTPMDFETNPIETGYSNSFSDTSLTPLLTPSERAETMKKIEPMTLDYGNFCYVFFR